MLSIYTFLPLLLYAMVALVFASVGSYAFLPDWFVATGLSWLRQVEFLAYTIATLTVFLVAERTIRFSNYERKEIISRVIVSTAASLFFLGFTSITTFSIDLRELSQTYSVNLLYNALRVLSVFFFFGLLGKGQKHAITLGIIIGFFNAYSGSKLTILLPILMGLLAVGRVNVKTVFPVVIVATLGAFSAIPVHYFYRYIDIALSAYQTAYIFDVTGTPLVKYHWEAISRLLHGQRGFNPIIEYLRDTGIASGYNLTPTIVGEMMASGPIVGLIILLYLISSLFAARKLWKPDHERGARVFACAFFVLLGVMQSTLLDAISFSVLFILLYIGLQTIRSLFEVGFRIRRDPNLNVASKSRSFR